MTTLVSYIKFETEEQVNNANFYKAVPEREDDIIGELPDGRKVLGYYKMEDDGWWLLGRIIEDN